MMFSYHRLLTGGFFGMVMTIFMTRAEMMIAWDWLMGIAKQPTIMHLHAPRKTCRH